MPFVVINKISLNRAQPVQETADISHHLGKKNSIIFESAEKRREYVCVCSQECKDSPNFYLVGGWTNSFEKY